MFFRGSRYQHVADKEHRAADGRMIRFKALRSIPETRGITGYVVDTGDRVDRVAFHQLGDPERFWRIADANVVIDPDELVAEPGRVIDIPEAT